MAKKVIISTPQGNVNGTPLDAAFTMCNDNFTELYNGATSPESAVNTVLIGAGAGSPSQDSGSVDNAFMQIPISDGIPTAGGGVKGPGAMYFESGVSSGITAGLYISDTSGTLQLISAGPNSQAAAASK